MLVVLRLRSILIYNSDYYGTPSKWRRAKKYKKK